MNSLSAKLATLLVLLLSISLCHADAPAPKKPVASAKSSSKAGKTAHKASKKHSARSRGQKAIDGDRVRQIQQALVREHYMTAEPNGKWDEATQNAMRRYQADQGWQNKSVPDSRALIRLGLGPDQGHLLNPDSAMTSAPPRGTSGARVSATASAPASIRSQSSTPVSTGVSGLPDVTPSR
jgi:peptidoglycan hydrolase-like protein with peptidoglycan-binding domain